MRPIRIVLLFGLACTAFAQQVVQLPMTDPAAGTWPEKRYFSAVWNTEVVSNVTRPSLTVYKPSVPNGIGVIVCPGGGFMALSINSEGIEVAKWLNAKGVTAFVLKYRLAHTGEDATREFTDMWNDKLKLRVTLDKAVPLAIADGLTAMEYVKKHAADFGVATDKIGIVGFSAGGTLAAAAALQYGPGGRPAFAAPIYGATSLLKNPVPADAPPLFVAAAQDDGLALAPDSVHLYEEWTAAHRPAELHMYTKGGHGFGMRKQNLPSDQWIESFWDWLQREVNLK